MENDEEQMIDFKCPYCGQEVSFPGMDADTPQQCPFCSEALMVPRESCEIGPKFPLPIITQGLMLRRVLPMDADVLVKIGEDQELLAYHDWPLAGAPSAEEWFDAESKVCVSALSPELFLAIVLKDAENCIGLASLKYGEGTDRQPEFTIVIERSQLRKGYCTEAAQGLLEFGFRGLKMRRMTAHCDDRNDAFIKLTAKIGLRQEGHFYGDRYVNGDWVNTVYFALLQDEYAKLKG